MGLFNFLKPKKGPSAELMKHPAMVGMELEYLQKQVANLISVNRSEDAQKAVNAFLLKYEKDSIGIAASRIDLVRISYSLAYFLLPSLVYTRWNEFCDLWNGGIPFPVYVAIKGANSNGKHLSMEQIQEFKYYQGNLEDELTYFLIQFPEPPESKEDASLESLLAKLEQKKYEEVPVPGPFFAVAISNNITNAKHVYTLGQCPSGGTTLRFVSAEMNNCNCGPGPFPTPNEFLKAVAGHLKRTQQGEGL